MDTVLGATDPKLDQLMVTLLPVNHIAPTAGLVMVKPDRGTKGKRVKKAVAVHWASVVDVKVTRKGPAVINGGMAHSTVLVVDGTEEVTVASSVPDDAG